MTRLKTAWRTARDGTKRTAGWAAGGVRSLFRRSSDESAPSSDGAAAKPAAAAHVEDTPGDPGRGRKIAIFAAAGLIVAIWIGWTAYVWNENGSTAGIGVLVSWPAVFAALALVAATFVGAGIFVRSQRTAGEGDLAAPETTTAEPESAEDPATASQPGTPHAASPHHRSPVGSLSEAEDVPADDDAEDEDDAEDGAAA